MKMTDLPNFLRIKYDFDKKAIEPGLYTLHRPSQCNIKFPTNNFPIHKKIKNPLKGRQIVEIPQNDRITQMIIKSGEKIIYPAIWPKNKYEEMKEKADKPHTQEADEGFSKSYEELRKARLEAIKKSYPEQKKTKFLSDNDDIDQLKRATVLKNEDFQGARIANQIIMASKCHAIRDAQIAEKSIIKTELELENKRLDEMMEADRLFKISKEREKYEADKKQKLENTKHLQNQIVEREKQKQIELLRKQRECALINQQDIVAQTEEMQCLNKKREDAAKLKEFFHKSYEEARQYKERQREEEIQLEDRIRMFIQRRREREAKLKEQADIIKSTKAQQFDTMAKARQAEKDMKEELEALRILKIREDVERQHREKEKAAAIKKIEEIRKLQLAREKQIADRHRQMAREISREEEVHEQVVKKNESDANKDVQKTLIKKEALLKYKEEIMKQMSEKERKRIEKQSQHLSESKRIKEELEEKYNLEKLVVQKKVQDMKDQRIPDKYVNEVKHKLSKLKYV